MTNVGVVDFRQILGIPA